MQAFRWVNQLAYQDRDGRSWQLNALEGTRPLWKRFGSLKNVARRLLDRVRFVAWQESWFDPRPAGKLRVEWDSS